MVRTPFHRRGAELALMGLLVLSSGAITSLFAASVHRAVPRDGDDPDAAPYGFVEYLPAAYAEEPERSFPLIMFLHGAGEKGSGTDFGTPPNHTDTNLWKKVTKHGPHKLIKNSSHELSSYFDDHDVIVLSPQEPSWWNPDKLDQFMRWALERYRIDEDRIYVTGLSMGGAGTWSYGRSYGERVAAVVPICGANGPTDTDAYNTIAVWAFHAYGDGTVSRNNSINWVNHIAGERSGGDATNVMSADGGYDPENDPPAGGDRTAEWTAFMQWRWMDGVPDTAGYGPMLTLYPDGSHDSWTRTYNRRVVWDWLLSQRLGGGVNAPGAPVITVDSPSVGSRSIAAGAELTFAATAVDDEDGTLPGDALVWYSSIDGELGSGSPLTIGTLSLGRHAMSVVAQDSDGHVGVAQFGLGVYRNDTWEAWFDFGDQGEKSSGNYNNITDSSSGRVGNVIDRSGAATGCEVVIGDPFQSYNQNGVDQDGLFGRKANKDAFWVDRDGNASATVVFRNLNPGFAYRIACLASRTSNNNPITHYSIGGEVRTLNIIDNIDTVAEFTAVQPAADGTITLRIDHAPGDRFGFLSALSIAASSAELDRRLTMTVPVGYEWAVVRPAAAQASAPVADQQTIESFATQDLLIEAMISEPN